MGQQEILNTLSKARKKLSSKEITERIGVSKGCVARCLKNLYEQGAIFRNVAKTGYGIKYVYWLS